MSKSNRLRVLWVLVLAIVFPLVAMAGGGGEGGNGIVLPAVQISGGGSGTPTSRPRENFATVKYRADKSYAPLDAVVVWQSYIESGVTGEDLDKAKAELKIWQERVKEEAILINKKWVGGKEKKAIQAKVQAMMVEAHKLVIENQTIEGLKKIEDAAKVWPENFSVQFLLGYIALDKQDLKKATLCFENCQRIRPNSPAVLNNLGACYALDRMGQDRGIATLLKSVKIQDAKVNVQNLVTAMRNLTAQSAKNPRYKEAVETAKLLMGKYGISGPANSFYRMDLEEDTAVGGDDSIAGKNEILGNGSGFVISADGLILTNRHVAKGGSIMMIQFNDETQKIAEVVVIDDEQDLALLRVKPEKPLAFVKLAPYDNPPDGARCVVMGFPAASMLGLNMKTTQGAVSAGNNKGEYDVALDAKVNPGNSGGPVFDDFGNVMAIASAKIGLAAARIDDYGLGIGSGRIRKFLAKNNIKVEAGTKGTERMSPEEVSAKNRMATVLVLISGKPGKEE